MGINFKNKMINRMLTKGGAKIRVLNENPIYCMLAVNSVYVPSNESYVLLVTK